jgi:hypothetical protein
MHLQAGHKPGVDWVRPGPTHPERLNSIRAATGYFVMKKAPIVPKAGGSRWNKSARVILLG